MSMAYLPSWASLSALRFASAISSLARTTRVLPSTQDDLTKPPSMLSLSITNMTDPLRIIAQSLSNTSFGCVQGVDEPVSVLSCRGRNT
ncbi:hypothetical protein [Kaistia adipata]|uniref:hypothetical protein n=1 Tax=Kaistia adipata TaxID=166954 RepID=UPI0012EB39A6|nr:hypothetical protein [Kaistia adipata]